MTQPNPQITTFGPYRAIGMSVTGGDSSAFKALWERFVQRFGEIEMAGDGQYFGICRCVPGATDGSFEYVAAVSAKHGTAVPEGMIEAAIPECTYAVFEVAGLEQIMQAWMATPEWLAAHPEWEAYCNVAAGGECDCPNHPCFELYPPDFETVGKLFIYVPIRAKV